MICAIFLVVASLSWGQSTGTVSTSLDDELKISNLGKAVRELESGRPRITGLPTFANGIKFSDGTTQTTAATGNASLSANQTFTGNNTFSATSTMTYTAGMGYSGIAGGIITSSVGISGATSTTLTFDGTRYPRVRIVVEGSLAAAADATISLIQYNASNSGYISSGLYGYSAGAGGIPEQTTGILIWRAASTVVNSGVMINIYCRTSVDGTLLRACLVNGGGGWTSGWSLMAGGTWSDTSTAITSMRMAWGSAFTGNVYVYRD